MTKNIKRKNAIAQIARKNSSSVASNLRFASPAKSNSKTAKPAEKWSVKISKPVPTAAGECKIQNNSTVDDHLTKINLYDRMIL